MVYYVNRTEHLDGDLILYQRNLTTAAPKSKSHRKPTWYMKLRIGGKKRYVERSTKLTVYEDAYAFAKSELYRLQQAVRLGHTLNEFSFEQHWQDWYDRQIRNGTWKEERQRWHKNYAARYFKPYFHLNGSSVLLNDITPKLASGYWDWRINYWSTQAGASLQAYNPKRRRAKTTSARNVKKVPAPKTLAMEQSALNQILWDAREQGRLQHLFKMKAPRTQQPHVRRPHFEGGREYNTLVRYLRSYRDCSGIFKDDQPNEWHKQQRIQFYHFVLFLLNSGLRVGEAREMRWVDIKFDQEVDDENDLIAVVNVRKAGKTGKNRDAQTQPTGNKTLKEWKLKSKFTDPDDFVWFGQKTDAKGKPSPFTDLNKSFQSFLARVPVKGRTGGLLYNSENERRTLYSLRHTYATIRREKGNVSSDDLALNMGCKREQIERHYVHSTPNSRRTEIVKTRKKRPPIAPQFDPFILEAMKRHQEGSIDDAGLLVVLNSKKLNTP